METFKMERKLVTVKQIRDIQPIEDADKIELAFIDGWQCVTAKDNGFKKNDLCIYFEIDSLLPELPDTEFLRPKNFRIRTIKLKGVLSQGIIFPLDFLKNFTEGISILEKIKLDEISFEGYDLSEIIGVEKYEQPIPACLGGQIEGYFPNKCPRTDAERCQNLSYELQQYKELVAGFVVTEKLDGSSASFMLIDDVFKVCSRNLDLTETEGNTFWQVARKNDIEAKMRFFASTHNIKEFAIQGELVGEGIQKNKYKLKGHDVYLFNAFNIDTQTYFTWSEFIELIDVTELKQVPVISDSYSVTDDTNALLLFAEGKSVLCDTTEREGIVFKSKHINNIRTSSFGQILFKAISNKFLLKYDE